VTWRRVCHLMAGVVLAGAAGSALAAGELVAAVALAVLAVLAAV
jgi:tetrahydromethanopterin S-methyltransferase subunit F